MVDLMKVTNELKNGCENKVSGSKYLLSEFSRKKEGNKGYLNRSYSDLKSNGIDKTKGAIVKKEIISLLQDDPSNGLLNSSFRSRVSENSTKNTVSRQFNYGI
jgi:hypothetical protein